MRLILLSVLVFCSSVARAAWAGDFQPVECADTPFRFHGTGLDVSCLRNAVPLHDQIMEEVDEIYVHDTKRIDYVVLIDVRYVGGFQHRVDLQKDLASSFPDTFDNQWHETEKRGGFETATYRSTANGGGPIDCIAVRRYVDFESGGVSRLLIGHACSETGSPAHMYDLLGQITAPGD